MTSWISALQVTLAIDPSLGRLDYDSLSDQALMEMLIDQMDTKEKNYFQDDNGNYKDVGEWPGVQCSESDDERVVTIELSGLTFSPKQFPFKFIPPMVSYFGASQSNVQGTLEASHLPSKLTALYISHNKLHGPLNFAEFPRQMEKMHINANKFCGSLQLADLPRSLKDFIADKNQFCGEINLNDLPPAMEEFDVSNNILTGSVHIERLPEGVKDIILSYNSFLGTFRLMAITENLSYIDVRGNALSPTAVLGDVKTSVHGEAHFLIHGIATVVDANGNVHAWSDDLTLTDDDNDEFDDFDDY